MVVLLLNGRLFDTMVVPDLLHGVKKTRLATSPSNYKKSNEILILKNFTKIAKILVSKNFHENYN